jgi:very-short-patch-repair endonuclease
MWHRRIRHAVLRGQRVDPAKLEHAKEMRRHPTPAEAQVWEILRGRRLDGLKWRRQQVIAGFIADFYCAELRIVLEVDGDVHNGELARAVDEERTVVLTRLDLRIVRVRNDAIDADSLRRAIAPITDVQAPPLP